MLIYSAGPIDQASHGTQDQQRLLRHLRITVVVETAKANGWAVFRPDLAYTFPRSETCVMDLLGPMVDAVNRAAIDRAQVVVATLVSGIPTLGTPSEIDYALGMDIPVVVVTDEPTASGSVQIAAWRQRGARIVSLGMSQSMQDLHAQRQEVRAQVVAAVNNGNRPRPPLLADRVPLTDVAPLDQAEVLQSLPDGRLQIELHASGLVDSAVQARQLIRERGLRLSDFGIETERVHAGWTPQELVAMGGHLLFAPTEAVDVGALDGGRTTDYSLRRAYDDDAGFDLVAIGDYEIAPGARASVRCSVSIAPPADHWALMLGRSSTWSRSHLMTIPGVIDTGWRGPLYAQVINLGPNTVQVRHNDRVAQLILLPTWQGRATPVTQLPDHPRGTNGFGSSGS